MKAWVWMAALGVAAAGCTATKQAETVSTPPAPPPVAAVAAARPSLLPAQPVPGGSPKPNGPLQTKRDLANLAGLQKAAAPRHLLYGQRRQPLP